MKNTVIVLLVVALIVLVVGAVNQDQRVDLDYVFGTWNDVSVFALSAIAAAAIMVVGVTVAAMARIGVVGDRRKLERELEQVYPRLREAERAAGVPEWHPAEESPAIAGEGAGSSAGDASAAAAEIAPEQSSATLPDQSVEVPPDQSSAALPDQDASVVGESPAAELPPASKPAAGGLSPEADAASDEEHASRSDPGGSTASVPPPPVPAGGEASDE